MRRSWHYTEAERLAERAVQRLAESAAKTYPLLRETAREDALLDLRAALVHATLATAGPGVEQEVIDKTKRDTDQAKRDNDAATEWHAAIEQRIAAGRPPAPAPKPGPPSTQGASR